jgi:hypothetical protein
MLCVMSAIGNRKTEINILDVHLVLTYCCHRSNAFKYIFIFTLFLKKNPTYNKQKEG